MSINDRIDQMTRGENTSAPVEILGDPQPSMEPVQVAGLGKVLRDFLRGSKQAAKELPPSIDVAPTAPQAPILSTPKIKPPTEKAAERIFPSGKKPGVTVPRQPEVVEKLITPKVADDVATEVERRGAAGDAAMGKPGGDPDALFNYMRTGLTGEADTFIDEVAKAAGVVQPARVTHAEVLEDLARIGYKPKDLDWITNYADNTEQMRKVAMAREALMATARMTTDLAKQLTANPSADLAAKYHQSTVLLGQLSRGVKNMQTDYARALGVMRATPEGDATALIQFVDEAGGIDNIVAHAGKLAKLDMNDLASIKKAADLSETGMYSKVKDIWVTTWINGLLSSPVTHAKNILGNELFTAIQVPERFTSSLFGRLRGADVGDRVEMDEAVSMVRGMMAGQIKALDAFATSFVNNAPVTGSATKMSDAGATISDFGDHLGVGGMIGRGLNLYGKAVTLPGRALMAEDEFFKTQGYFMELYAQASRRSAAARQAALDAGKTADEAREAARATYLDVIDNPPTDINAASWNASKYVTFTEELERGTIGRRFQDLAAENVVARMMMPFVRTPINIAAATLERTPFAFVLPSFREAFKAGGIARDMALARVAVGSSLLTTGGFLASAGRVTGAGPADPGQREALKNSGWQPYSVVFDRSELDDDTRGMLNQYGRLSDMGDKVFWSFQGLEPLGGILGMAADYADFARFSDKDEDLEQMGMGIAYALATYTMELPYLQGMAEFVKTLTGGKTGAVTADSVQRMMTYVQKTATSFVIGGSPAGALSSAQAVVERTLDPTASDIKVPGGERFRGVWEAINQYKSRVPGLSATLPPLTNRWGEVVEYGEGALYEVISPIRVRVGKQKDVDRIWLEYDMPRGQPSRKVSWQEHGGMAGLSIELTAEQFNELKSKYGSSGVQEALVIEATDPAFQRLSLRDKQRFLLKIDQAYMDAARSWLVNESRFAAELQAKFMEQMDRANTYGINSDMLQ